MARIRVLVVDDSVVIRKLVSDLLAEDPDIEVVGTAVNGRAGLQKIALLKPDLVTMDIEMPEMNGIETVRSLRQSGSRIPIIMFSTLTERGAEATLDALAAGASDYVAEARERRQRRPVDGAGPRGADPADQVARPAPRRSPSAVARRAGRPARHPCRCGARRLARPVATGCS